MDAIEVLRATAPHPESPLPWRAALGVLFCATRLEVCGPNGHACDAAHIAAAVNAAPVLLARVAELEAQLAAAREAVAKIPSTSHDLGCRRTSWERIGCDCDTPAAVNAARRALKMEA